jgi:hypothetical protein
MEILLRLPGIERQSRSHGRENLHPYHSGKTGGDVVCVHGHKDAPAAVAPQQDVSDMPKSPSSQYGLKDQEDIDPRGIRVTNGPMR